MQVKVSVYRHTSQHDSGRIFLGLKNVTIDICRFLEGKVTSTLMNLVAAEMQNCSNAFHPCPYSVRRFVMIVR